MGAMNFVTPGAALARVDGKLKVTGGALYGSDARVVDPAYAYLVVSSIARGEIAAFDDAESRRVPGILDILTYQNVGEAIGPGTYFGDGGYLGSSIAPLSSNKVHHGGQIVAVMLANSFEAAREAAYRLKVTYAEQTPSASFDSPGTEIVAGTVASKKHKDPAVGDATAAFASSAARVEASYSTPTQHHNPIETLHHRVRLEWRQTDDLGIQPERARFPIRRRRAAADIA
jgi:xanthine dehydrogenase YagR molybdenum-binding subunit